MKVKGKAQGKTGKKFSPFNTIPGTAHPYRPHAPIYICCAYTVLTRCLCAESSHHVPTSLLLPPTPHSTHVPHHRIAGYSGQTEWYLEVRKMKDPAAEILACAQ